MPKVVHPVVQLTFPRVFDKLGGPIVRENSKLLAVIVFDAPAFAPKVEAIVDAYKVKFKQQSVLRVEHPVCAAL